MSGDPDGQPLWAAEVPAGQVRHTTNLPSRQAQIVVVGVVAMTIGILALALRLFTRLRILRKRLTTADCEAPYVPYPSKLETALADLDVADFSILAMACGIVAFALTMKRNFPPSSCPWPWALLLTSRRNTARPLISQVGPPLRAVQHLVSPSEYWVSPGTKRPPVADRRCPSSLPSP